MDSGTEEINTSLTARSFKFISKNLATNCTFKFYN